MSTFDSSIEYISSDTKSIDSIELDQLIEDNNELNETLEDNIISYSEHNLNEINAQEAHELVVTYNSRDNYVSKDNSIVWSCHTISGRTPSNNIINFGIESGAPVDSLDTSTPASAFNHFIKKDMLEEIVVYTNRKGSDKLGEKWQPMDLIELKAFIGLLLLAGAYKSNNESTAILWHETHGRPLFRATMSCERFKNILLYVRFDAYWERNSNPNSLDKFSPIRKFFEEFIDVCRTSYNPGPNLTVDEQLYPFRERVPFLVYMPKKPSKYGLKFWIVCDSDSRYVLNVIPYLGKINNQREFNLSFNVVVKLTHHLLNSGKSLTFDNYFTTWPLAQFMQQNQTSILGTVRKNRTFIPPEFLPHKNREVNSTLFGFYKQFTLISYVPRKNKAVILLSSEHRTPSISAEPHRKPEAILDYNIKKCGVDIVDQCISTYTCKRKCRRWPFAVFCQILDLAAFNSYIVYSQKNPEFSVKNKSARRQTFLLDLAVSLVRENQQRRSMNPKVINHPAVKRSLEIIGFNFESTNSIHVGNGQSKQRKRSEICPSNIIRRSKQICSTCARSICNEHAIKTMMCHNCKNNLE